MKALRWIPVIAVVLAVPGMASAQTTRPLIDIVPQAGYLKQGDLMRGPLGTSIGSDNGVFYGVQLGVNVTPTIALTGSVGYAEGDLTAGLPVLGAASFGRTETLLYDAGLQLRLPLGHPRITPFVQAGAGAARYRLESGLINTDATNPAFHIGGGLDLDVSPTMGLRLQVRDYIGRFDVREAVLVDVGGTTSHSLAITLGFRVGF